MTWLNNLIMITVKKISDETILILFSIFSKCSNLLIKKNPIYHTSSMIWCMIFFLQNQSKRSTFVNLFFYRGCLHRSFVKVKAIAYRTVIGDLEFESTFLKVWIQFGLCTRDL